MKHTPIALIIFLGTSCAIMGRKIDTTLIKTLNAGASTTGDAIKLLGQPPL